MTGTPQPPLMVSFHFFLALIESVLISAPEHVRDLATEPQTGEDAYAISASHYETQGNSQPNNDEDTYADEADAVGNETIYEDAHGDLPEDDQENNEYESNPIEDHSTISALPHFSENDSITSGFDHSTADEQVDSEDKLEHPDSTDLKSLHPSDDVGGVAGGELQAHETVYGDDDEGDDLNGEGAEDGGFDDADHDVVHEGEYEAVLDDVADNERPDGAHSEGDDRNEGIGASVPGDNIEDSQHDAENDNPEDFEAAAHDDPTYGSAETADLQDEYSEEEHVEPVQGDEDSTTCKMNGSYCFLFY